MLLLNSAAGNGLTGVPSDGKLISQTFVEKVSFDVCGSSTNSPNPISSSYCPNENIRVLRLPYKNHNSRKVIFQKNQHDEGYIQKPAM